MSKKNSNKTRHGRYHWMETEIIEKVVRPKLVALLQSRPFSSYQEISDAFLEAHPEATVNPTIIKEWLTTCDITLEKRIYVSGLENDQTLFDGLPNPTDSDDTDGFDNEGTTSAPDPTTGGFKEALQHVGADG